MRKIRVIENGKQYYVVKFKTYFIYYKDKEHQIVHREDGPAVECRNGRREWYKNGKRHREDGPAIEYENGEKAFFIKGYALTEEDYWEKVNEKRRFGDFI